MPDHELSLSNGRAAKLRVERDWVNGGHKVGLYQGTRYLPDQSEIEAYKCRSCTAQLEALDEFCAACGGPANDPEGGLARAKAVGQATSAIRTVAVLFAIFGVVMFFVGRVEAQKALENLSAFADGEVLAPIDGVTYTAGELRSQVRFEMWSGLAVNFLLAGLMGLFAYWSRSQPLPAILSAAALYAVVIVGSAIIEPTTLARGLVIKVIVITYLVRGMKAAAELRRQPA